MNIIPNISLLFCSGKYNSGKTLMWIYICEAMESNRTWHTWTVFQGFIFWVWHSFTVQKTICVSLFFALLFGHIILWTITQTQYKIKSMYDVINIPVLALPSTCYKHGNLVTINGNKKMIFGCLLPEKS